MCYQNPGFHQPRRSVERYRAVQSICPHEELRSPAAVLDAARPSSVFLLRLLHGRILSGSLLYLIISPIDIPDTASSLRWIKFWISIRLTLHLPILFVLHRMWYGQKMIFHLLDLFLLVNYQLWRGDRMHLALDQFVLNVFRLIFVQHFLHWCLLYLRLVTLGRWALLFGLWFCLWISGRRAMLMLRRPRFHFFLVKVFHELDRSSSNSFFAIGAWFTTSEILGDWSLIFAGVGERLLV